MENTHEVQSTEKTGQELLNDLIRIAPLDLDKTEQQLKEEGGWEEVTSIHAFEPNGAANKGDIEFALRVIDEKCAPSLRDTDWKLCCVRAENPSKDPELDRVWIILRKKTEARLKWEREQGAL